MIIMSFFRLSLRHHSRRLGCHYLHSKMAISLPAPERTRELVENLSTIRSRVAASAASVNSGDTARESVTLVAVSKLHAAEDILACYSEGNQRDFGENYVQELVDKAAAVSQIICHGYGKLTESLPQLPQEIQWHFIGSLQSNKAKTLAGALHHTSVDIVLNVFLSCTESLRSADYIIPKACHSSQQGVTGFPRNQPSQHPPPS